MESHRVFVFLKLHGTLENAMQSCYEFPANNDIGELQVRSLDANSPPPTRHSPIAQGDVVSVRVSCYKKLLPAGD